MTTREKELLQAIRAHCLECSGGSRALVRRCVIEHCTLWPYRAGEPRKEAETVEGQICMTFEEDEEA